MHTHSDDRNLFINGKQIQLHFNEIHFLHYLWGKETKGVMCDYHISWKSDLTLLVMSKKFCY
jgi:hypothetical protein